MPRSRPTASAWTRTVVALLFGLAIAAGASAADTTAFTSTWRSEPIRIDGNTEDWQGHLQAVHGQHFSVGLMNDDEAFYFCLVTTDRTLVQQITRQGLMVWFDPPAASPKKHVFGVQFPIDPRLVAMRDPGRIYARDASVDQEPGEAAQEGIGILSGKGDAKRIPIEESGGIQARVTLRGEALIYELKVPIRKAGAEPPYAIPAAPGGEVRFTLQTPEWRGPLPPQRGPVGVGVAMTGPGGRGVVGYPAVDSTLLKPMELKATLRLASAK